MIRTAMARIATSAQVVTVLANVTLNLLSASDLSLVGINRVPVFYGRAEVDLTDFLLRNQANSTTARVDSP